MIGIDVSKDTLSCAYLHDQTHALLWEVIVPNTADGVRQMLHKTPTNSALVVEPTGKYSSLVVKQSVESGRRVLLAAPKKAKCFLRSIQSRAKTDKLESRGLALYALSQPLALYPIKSPPLEQIDELLAARRGISSSLSRLKQQRDALPYAKEVLSPAIAALKQQKVALDKEIAQVAPKSDIAETIARLRNVPGIGAITATTVASCLSSKNFSHPDKFVAYIGLDVSIVQSGRRQGERGLTHQGDPEIRRLLYLCAQSNLIYAHSPTLSMRTVQPLLS